METVLVIVAIIAIIATIVLVIRDRKKETLEIRTDASSVQPLEATSSNNSRLVDGGSRLVTPQSIPSSPWPVQQSSNSNGGISIGQVVAGVLIGEALFGNHSSGANVPVDVGSSNNDITGNSTPSIDTTASVDPYNDFGNNSSNDVSYSGSDSSYDSSSSYGGSDSSSSFSGGDSSGGSW